MPKCYSIATIKLAKESGQIKKVLFTRNSDMNTPGILKEVEEALKEIDGVNSQFQRGNRGFSSVKISSLASPNKSHF